MSNLSRAILLILVMSTAAIAAGGVTLAVLYDAAVEQNHQRLQETARGHARMIEAIARHSLANVPPNLSNKDAMQRAEADTLAQVRDAHAHFAGFGKSGEFTLAKRDGDNIVFLLSHRWHDLDNPQPVPFDSDLAEPMRHALRRESGTLFGLDYRGQRVQAAFEPVGILNLGVVAKIDVSEIRAPFYRAAAIAAGFSVLIILGGVGLFIKLGRPIIVRLERNEQELLQAISERDQLIRESKERLRETFEQDALGIAHVAADGRFLRVNQRLCDILGYTEQELLNTDFQSITHPDDLARDLEHVRQTLAGATTSYTLDKRYRRKNGSIVWTNLNGMLLHDAMGKPKYFVCVVGDISLRKQAEAALQLSEERYRSLVSATTAIVWTTDAEGHFVVPQKSWQAYTGQTWVQARGGGWADALHPDDRAHVQEVWSQAVSHRTIYRAEGRIWSAAHEEYRYFVVRAVPLLDSKGEVREWVGTVSDVHDNRMAEIEIEQQAGELARSNAELEQFAYVASHDLRAPLRAIDTLSTWIEEDLAGKLTGESRENMDLMRKRVRRLETLLDDLLQYSRAGRSGIEVKPTDTAELIADIITLLNPPSGFRVDVKGPMPVFDTARGPLDQVFRNLIANAIKHHDRQTGHIVVSVQDREDHYEFTVADDGPGIPPNLVSKAFQMFQTLKPRDEVEGSGMGLALVRKLVEWQGGRISVEPGPDGRGAAFRFTWRKLWQDETTNQ